MSMGGSRVETSARFQVIKVFSATKANDRAALGERVTDWMAGHPELQISQTIVRQSSDRQFHCISIVLVCEQR
jgi:hypothetical protein